MVPKSEEFSQAGQIDPCTYRFSILNFSSNWQANLHRYRDNC